MTERERFFTYHPRTDKTGPKFDALLAAEQAASTWALGFDSAAGPGFHENAYAPCFAVMGAFYDAVMEHVPTCAARERAVQEIRLARALIADAVRTGNRYCTHGDTLLFHYGERAAVHIIEARLLSEAAIACGG